MEPCFFVSHSGHRSLPTEKGSEGTSITDGPLDTSRSPGTLRPLPFFTTPTGSTRKASVACPTSRKIYTYLRSHSSLVAK